MALALQIGLLAFSALMLVGHRLRRDRPRRSRRWTPTKTRPTRQGYWYLLVTFGVMFAALNTGNNLLYLLLALLLSFLVLHGVLAEWNLRRVSVERRLPGEVFAGRPAGGAFRVRNPRRWLGTYALRLEEVGDAGVQAEGASRYVPPGGDLEIPAAWAFERRGGAELRAIRLASTFPFGLFHRSIERPAPAELLVWPEPDDGHTPPGGADRGADVEDPRRPGGTGEVLGLREYQPGDPLRRVHWPTSARVGAPVVVERASDGARRFVVRVGGGELERAVSRAAGETVRHFQEGCAVGLELGELRLEPRGDDRQRRRILDALATWEGP
jgi:uncharacterized protein (DUF58 family)